MAKLLLILLTISGINLTVSAQTNLLSNPDARQDLRHWKVYGDVSVTADDVPRFAVHSGHMVQIVPLDGAAGKFLVLIGRGATEKSKSDRIITGLPSLTGYLLSTFNPHGVNQINTYMFAGTPKAASSSPDQPTKFYGIYQIPLNTLGVQATVSRAIRKDEEDDGSAAIFFSIGLYLFGTREEAVAFAKGY